MNEMTQTEQVARSYSAAMDSVNLINSTKPVGISDTDWVDTIKRNKEHLQIQIAKVEFYAGYDMLPLENAIAKQ